MNERDVLTGAGLTFLHGAAGRGDVWQLQVLAFPQAQAPDLPGRMGEERPQTVPGLVAALRPILEASTVLVGHSLGGAVALQYALESGARLRGLVLMSTGARFPEAREWSRRVAEEGAAGEALAMLAERFFGPATHPRLKEKSLTLMRALDPGVIRADFAAAAAFDVRDRIGGILQPVLVMAGTADRVVAPREPEFLSAHLPHAEPVWIEEAGHMLMLEQPQAVNEAIRAFLDRLEREEPRPSSRYNR